MKKFNLKLINIVDFINLLLIGLPLLFILFNYLTDLEYYFGYLITTIVLLEAYYVLAHKSKNKLQKSLKIIISLINIIVLIYICKTKLISWEYFDTSEFNYFFNDELVPYVIFPYVSVRVLVSFYNNRRTLNQQLFTLVSYLIIYLNCFLEGNYFISENRIMIFIIEVALLISTYAKDKTNKKIKESKKITHK